MIHFKHILLVLIVLSFTLPVIGQQNCRSSLSGIVLSENGESLYGASITISSSVSSGTITNEEGKFIFNNICDDTYDVSVHYIGYKSITSSIQVTGNTQLTFRLEPSITELREVVVQGTLLNTEHAQNFSVLNAKKLAEATGKTLGESLKEIPGVSSIQTGPGIFKPVIHGVHSQRILLLNYGIRQEGQQWGAEHAPEIDPFVASTMIVVKDASSIKYGTDALGGVIIINPPSLPEEAGVGGSIETIAQSNGRSGIISGMLEGGIKNHDGWGWRVQGTAKRTGDFHAPDYSLTNTGIRELNFSAATGYHHANKGFEVFFSHFNSEIGILKGTSIGNTDDLMNAMERTQPLYTTGFGYNIEEPRQEVTHNLLKINGHINMAAGD